MLSDLEHLARCVFTIEREMLGFGTDYIIMTDYNQTDDDVDLALSSCMATEIFRTGATDILSIDDPEHQKIDKSCIQACIDDMNNNPSKDLDAVEGKISFSGFPNPSKVLICMHGVTEITMPFVTMPIHCNLSESMIRGSYYLSIAVRVLKFHRPSFGFRHPIAAFGWMVPGHSSATIVKYTEMIMMLNGIFRKTGISNDARNHILEHLPWNPRMVFCTLFLAIGKDENDVWVTDENDEYPEVKIIHTPHHGFDETSSFETTLYPKTFNWTCEPSC